MNTPIHIEHTTNCQPHPWHPSVVYFKNKWSGYHFWMVETPYPPFHIDPYVDRYELPCIHFSNDGLSWHSIDSNPIDDLTLDDIQQKNYYSDPHLVFKNGILECFYRFTILNQEDINERRTILYKKSSRDGGIWSPKEIVLDTLREDDVAKWGTEVVSPAIIWTGDKYVCWYVDANGKSSNRNIRKIESVDGQVWEVSKICVIDGKTVVPWHIDVIYDNGCYRLIVYEMPGACLSYYESLDGINFVHKCDVLKPSGRKYDFYSRSLYRACIVPVNNMYHIYFSASTDTESSIGVLKTDDFQKYSLINGQVALKYKGFRYFLNYLFWLLKRRVRKLLLPK